MLTILSNNRITKSITAHVIDNDLHMPAADYAALPQASSPQQPASPAHNTLTNVSAHCRQLNRPLLRNQQADVWALGASADERTILCIVPLCHSTEAIRSSHYLFISDAIRALTPFSGFSTDSNLIEIRRII